MENHHLKSRCRDHLDSNTPEQSTILGYSKTMELKLLSRIASTKPANERGGFDVFFEGAGGLQDTAAGRSRYETYLNWLEGDEQRKKCLSQIELGSKDYSELKEDIWEQEVTRCMEILNKKTSEINKDYKSADWKIAIATHLKRTRLCKNPWLRKHLKMGSPSGICRYCSETESGKRPIVNKLLKEIS